MSPLERLREIGVLGSVDVQLARALSRLVAAPTDSRVEVATALVSRQLGAGHVCVDLAAVASGALAIEGLGRVWTSPPADAWISALADSPLVGGPGEVTPLVLDASGRLYLRRYYEYEARVAGALIECARRRAPALERGRLEASIERLFDGSPSQARAARCAAERMLCVIAGGPGTGKTSTVVKILSLLVEQARLRHAGQPLKAILLAPTGKAAARLKQAIRSAKAALAVDADVRAAIPESAMTIHRALGVGRRGPGRVEHDRQRPLVGDVIVLDEASMVDIALTARLLDALPPHARLIMLGDPDQLASVEAGAVLGDICGTRAPLQQGPLGGCIARLTESHRYTPDSGIAQLATAIDAGEGERALSLLADERYADVRLVDEPWGRRMGPSLERAVVRGYRPYLRAGDPARQLERFDGFRVLAAHRQGTRGVQMLNQRIADTLRQAGLVDGDVHYPGQPVIVTRNDYNVRLFNGDVGIVVSDGDGMRACFADPDPDAPVALRRFALGRLPAHEPAYALTVHRSQGSEFEEVHVVLPEQDSPILSRELLYTAVTRARRRLVIHGPPPLVRLAVGRAIHRDSGLRDALWGKGA